MIKIKQLKEEDILNSGIDLFVGASGFESRSIFQAGRLMKVINQKLILGFDNERENPIRKLNDKFLEQNGFEIKITSGEDINNASLNFVLQKIAELINTKENLSVYIDYSSMTKNWYSFLLYGLMHIKGNDKLKIYLGYSHGKYVPSDRFPALNRIVSPLFGYCDLDVPSRPTALIVGVGNEPNRIYGLKEYFDAVPYLFYTDNSYNQEYSEEAEEINNQIISETKKGNIFKYPVHDLIYTYNVLENLSLSLLKEYRVIIAPCGPKPFTMLSLICSLNQNNSLEVWRISPGSNLPVIEREATGLVSIIELTISNPST